jgi:hypothetical protein
MRTNMGDLLFFRLKTVADETSWPINHHNGRRAGTRNPRHRHLGPQVHSILATLHESAKAHELPKAAPHCIRGENLIFYCRHSLPGTQLAFFGINGLQRLYSPDPNVFIVAKPEENGLRAVR